VHLHTENYQQLFPVKRYLINFGLEMDVYILPIIIIEVNNAVSSISFFNLLLFLTSFPLFDVFQEFEGDVRFIDQFTGFVDLRVNGQTSGTSSLPGEP
jgi:hypothetical protein